MPAYTPNFTECPSNSLYTYLDYATISTLLCFHAAYPPSTHQGTLHLGLFLPPLLRPYPTSHSLPLPLVRTVPSADYLARTFRHSGSPHLSPFFSLTVRNWVHYLLPVASVSISTGLFFHLCKCCFPFFHSRQGFISFTFTTFCCFSLGRPPVCLQALVCGW